MEQQDYSLRLPNQILTYYQSHPEEQEKPNKVLVEEGFVAEITGQEYFIHTRVTLPLHDIDNGIGFGLWVKIDKEVYDQYLKIIDINEQYKDFWTIGTLANDWPGFEDTFGMKVKVKTVRVDEKVYITELLDQPTDVALVGALNLQTTNADALNALRTMVLSSMQN